MMGIVLFNRLACIILLLLILATFPSANRETFAADETVITLGFPSSDTNTKKGVPSGWELDRKTGKAALHLERQGDAYFLNMVSDQASFGIKRPVKINIKDYPFLSWTWKATKLPPGGDVRKSGMDDQAAQVYIGFSSTGFPAKFNTPIIGYIWDNEAPKEWTGRSPQIGFGKVRYVVIRNKNDKLGEWQTEKRNVYRDYQTLFKDLKGGEPSGPVQGISLYINSQHTRSVAECYIGNIYFSRK